VVEAAEEAEAEEVACEPPRTIRRYPSCLISCSESVPDGRECRADVAVQTHGTAENHRVISRQPANRRR
jgi:hypothetical protein